MAYNNGLPMNYFPYGNYSMPQQQPVQQQIQNGGIVNVQSEQEAQNYPVAQGTSVTFVNGNEQKIYIKTRGFSSLDKPIFETYKLVKEKNENESVSAESTRDVSYVEKHEFEALKADFDRLKKEIGGTDEQSNADNANVKSA